MTTEEHLMINMTRDEVKESLEKFPVVILPMGATEQHGHHLPLGVDIYLAEYFAKEVSKATGALVAPSLPFGYSWVWRDIPGTISLQQDHVEEIIKDVAHSVSRYGGKMLVLINGHDSNNSSMKYAVRELEDELDIPVIYLFYPNLSEVFKNYGESATWNGMIHACEFETSLMLNAQEHLVDLSKAVKEYPDTPDLYGMSTISLGDLSTSGVFGDPTIATKEKGQKMAAIFSEKMSNLVSSAYNDFVLKK
ncbi:MULTISPECIES: creatininase family protein [Enterococcus]|uniref:creatininase family protein n=1 Tax=Enterococcus TaxID=1350 RepID=UPI0010F912D1|nr:MULTISPECIES: creatininase family protein [Enterococcus]MDT2681301.1 creatininase family protein [Enterococcus gallinarum]